MNELLSNLNRALAACTATGGQVNFLKIDQRTWRDIMATPDLSPQIALVDMEGNFTLFGVKGRLALGLPPDTIEVWAYKDRDGQRDHYRIVVRNSEPTQGVAA